MKAGRAKDFQRHLHGDLDAASADDRADFGQLNRLVDAFGMDDGVV